MYKILASLALVIFLGSSLTAQKIVVFQTTIAPSTFQKFVGDENKNQPDIFWVTLDSVVVTYAYLPQIANGPDNSSCNWFLGTDFYCNETWIKAWGCNNCNYQWSGPGIFAGLGTDQIKVNVAGNYFLTADNCTADIWVNVFFSPNATITATTPANCGPTGSATVTPSGGTGTYTYLWPNGQTTATATGLAPGSYVVTVSNSGPNACTATATATILGGSDQTPPTIVCPQPIVQANSSGQCGAQVWFNNPTTSDNCTPHQNIFVLQIGGPASGAMFPVGTTTVTFRATDASGNSATCSFSVQVNDTQAPTLTCPGNQTLAVSSNTCNATLPNYTSMVSAADNCTPNLNKVQVPSAGTVLAPGMYSVNFMATDATGNTGMCAFNLEVKDLQVPTISCPNNITVSNTANLCGATVSYTIASNDNCACDPATMLVTGQASGTLFPTGLTTVTFRATDAANNSATCSFNVTVNDVQKPTISCPADIVQANSPGQCGAQIWFDNANSSDNCGSPAVVNLGVQSGSLFPVGVSTVMFRATDAIGNSATCSFTITVNDTQAPTISCPTNISVNTNNCTASINYNAPTATDNCGSPAVALLAGLPSGSSFPVGTTTNVWSVTDGTGKMAICTFTVKVKGPASIIGAISVTTSGDISTTLTDLCTGETTPASIWVDVDCPNQPPGCTMGASIVTSENATCNGCNDGKTTAAPVGGTPVYTYLWSNGQVGATALNLTAGTYTVTITDAAGCTASASANIIQPAPCTAPDAQFNLPQSGGLQLQFTNTSTGTAPMTYEWWFGDGGFSTDFNPTHTYSQPGVYLVTLRTTNDCGQDIINKTLTVLNGPTPVQEPGGEFNFTVGPNPTMDKVFVKAPTGDYEVLLVAANGQIVHDMLADGDFQISVNNLSAGIYFMNIFSEGKLIKSFPIVKQ